MFFEIMSKRVSHPETQNGVTFGQVIREKKDLAFPFEQRRINQAVRFGKFQFADFLRALLRKRI